MRGDCWGTWLIMLGFMDLGWPRVCRRSTSVLLSFDVPHADFFTAIHLKSECIVMVSIVCRADSRFAPSQWETALLCNDVSHLWPSDAILWHRSGSTLAQVMALCLMAPSHYLNQCWLIISGSSENHLREFHKRYLSHRYLTLAWKLLIIPPASTKLKGGYTGITLSVCLSVRLSICPSVDRIVSALYLQQYSSDPFHICTSYQATSEGVSRVMPVSKFKNFEFWRMF